MDFAQTAIYAIIAIVLLSLLYRVTPHKSVSTQKPRLVLFPKYVIRNLDDENVRNTLETLGFQHQGRGDIYARGHFLGDVSARWARLNVVVGPENLYIHSPLIVILFDTGDLWKIASALSDGTTSE